MKVVKVDRGWLPSAMATPTGEDVRVPLGSVVKDDELLELVFLIFLHIRVAFLDQRVGLIRVGCD